MDPQEQAAKYEQMARRIKSLEAIITGAGQTGDAVFGAQAARTRLLREVPDHVMKAYRAKERADGKRASESGIVYDKAQIMVASISGKEERYLAVKRAEEARQLAAKREEERKRKRESE